MTKIMNTILAFLYMSLVLPLFIGFGGLHALDLGDYTGGVVGLTVSTLMFIIVGEFIRLIYIFFKDVKRKWSDRVEFSESFMLAFTLAGAIASIVNLLYGIYTIFEPTSIYLRSLQLISLPVSIATLYLLYGYFVPRVKKAF